MIARTFHNWERRLASVDTNRVVRPFDWGLEWLPENGPSTSLRASHRPGAPPAEQIGDWVSHVMADTDAFFTPPPTSDYTLQPAPDGDLLTFPSALTTPHETNNTVYCRYFPAPLTQRGTNEDPAPLKGRPAGDAPAPPKGRPAVAVVGRPFRAAGKYRQYTVLFAACGVSSALGNVSTSPSAAGFSV